MQGFLNSDLERRGLLSSGWLMVMQNKRYVLWFWLLNLTLAEFGVAAFRNQAHATLDHSLYSSGLTRGFDLAVFIEMLARPDFGAMQAVTLPSLYLVILFFVATVLFLPGVFQGYASSYRLTRDEFFRACGRNLWRFIRLLIVAVFTLGIAAGLLFAAHHWLVKKAEESTNELMPFAVMMATLLIIFLAMTTLRIAFDLAEADVVLSDQNATRKSMVAGFRHTYRGWARLLGCYVLITIVAAIVLLIGLWDWRHFVPPDSVLRAFVVGQLTLLVLLVPRFWQRGVAVAYWKQKMMAPVVVVEPLSPEPGAAVIEPEPAPVIPSTPTV